MALYKSWCWAGVFAPELMLCVARAQVGVARTAWCAVWDGERLHERRRRSWRGISVGPGGARADGVALRFERGVPIEVTTGPAWTRKTPLRVTGTVLGREIDAPGLLDESSGRHARHTAWRWSAGASAGVVWNLVEGMHDGSPSERTVWVAGAPHEVGPQRFDGLAAVGDLRFSALATVAHRENYLVVASDYEQSFGTFEGTLPVAGAVHGWGVMERHEARW